MLNPSRISKIAFAATLLAVALALAADAPPTLKQVAAFNLPGPGGKAGGPFFAIQLDFHGAAARQEYSIQVRTGSV